MLFLDGVYIECSDGALCFPWVKAPTSAELTRLTQTLALLIGRYLERQGLLERDVENSYLAGDVFEGGPLEQLLGSSITYRIAVGPQQGRKVFTLQTLPACAEPFDDGVGQVAGFSLHAGVAARADQREKPAPAEVNTAFASLPKNGYGFARPARAVYWEKTKSDYWIRWTQKDDAAALWVYDPEAKKVVEVLQVRER